MSATNKTTYYELPVFIATDEPKWLTDWNGAMTIIDGAIAEAKTAADNAQTTANANTLAISGLSDSVSTISTALGTLTTNVTTVTGNVQRINELIGNGTPTTQDKTIIGAINELKAEIDALAPGGEVSAAEVSYDNTSSGLTADDVQDAIDEVAGDVATLDAKVGFPTRLNQGAPQYSPDGGLTWANFSGALSINEVESAETTSGTTLSYTFTKDHNAILIDCNLNEINTATNVPSPSIAASSSDFTLNLYHDRTALWSTGTAKAAVDSKTYYAENVKAGDVITFTATLTVGTDAHVMDYAIFTVN